jgi:hypothetical protein
MPDTIVIQSHAPDPPAWLRQCLDSVAGWAAGAGFAHRVAGDEFLARVPADLRARAHGRTQVSRTSPGSCGRRRCSPTAGRA